MNHRDRGEHRGKEKECREISPELNGLSRSIIGAAIEVHHVLCPGFLEGVYEEALCREFELRNISYERQVPVAIEYKGGCVGECRLDVLVEKRVVVEIKAVSDICPIHLAQVLSYLKATGKPVGLLINFNVVMLVDGVKRVIST